ncbi:hypothetical protein CLV94_2601 [Flavobacterium endophyticum]|uniref:UbiA prenyltransferase family protein n=1 Tax=Flavobacterium endophyticum TaxID=1540163 RepID=A0A495M7B8_9FLAO|nr:hypothetical protein [Flavobacterium endophyticum]RKS21966.1 hypothetical protein CLV94_2601 [Flavobacterium endophyticum]
MQAIRRLFDFYINGSIHVAVAVLSLVLMTNHMFQNSFDLPMAGFAFFGTIFGYNFIKYEDFFRNKKPLRFELKAIAIVSVISLLTTAFFFFCLGSVTQITAIIFFGLTFLYTVPVFSKKKNIRNWSGVKIYIVAICWSGVTTLLPLLNAGTEVFSDVILKCCQRFLLVISLILIFEIIDLKTDDPALKTVPQRIGVEKTKILGILILIPLYFLEFLKSTIDINQLFVNAILVITTALFMLFANQNRSKYYTSFWVESIPIFWLGMIYLV